MIVFADAGLKLGWQVRQRQAARVARPLAERFGLDAAAAIQEAAVASIPVTAQAAS